MKLTTVMYCGESYRIEWYNLDEPLGYKVIQERDGQEFPNLVGVFYKLFPIAITLAKRR